MDANLQKIAAFAETARCGSFTKAAESLNYTQSAVSRMVADLEKDWNVTLMERGRAGICLTSDGVRLLPFAQRICEEHRGLLAEVDAINGLESGLIRIGTISSVATHWLPRIIKRFQEDYPNIDYELLLGDYKEIEAWIEEGRVDCGFVRLPTRPAFQTIFLERDELMAILPEDHEYAQAESFPIQHLVDYPFMSLERGANAEVVDIFERNGLKMHAHFTTWDDYAVMSMIESGLGIAILPSLIMKRIPYRVVAKPLDKPAYRDITFAVRSLKNASLVTKKFVEYLRYRTD